MTQLKVEENGAWVTLLDTSNAPALNFDYYVYEAWPADFTNQDPGFFHTAATRTFTLRSVQARGAPTARGAFVRLMSGARVGQVGDNSITYGTSTSTYTAASFTDGQFARHAGFTAPSPEGAATINVTTGYAMPTTNPPLYLFATAVYN